MKIAVFGGSFNPIHNGHISMVKFLEEKFCFDKIIVVPIGIPSHKENVLAEGRDRLNMCRLALGDDSSVEVSSIEIEEEQISYTIDTLMKLKKIYPESEFYEVVGEDSAINLYLWKDYEKILRESRVLVFRRKILEQKPDVKKGTRENEYCRELIYVEAPYFPFSSTEIRKFLKKWDRKREDEVLKKMLPQTVLNYIRTNRLYL